MSDQLTASIVSIVNPWGKIIGAGFLVSEKRVITCAHVVAQALGISMDTSEMSNLEVPVVFPFANKEKDAMPQLSARVIFWRPAERLLEHEEDSYILKPVFTT